MTHILKKETLLPGFSTGLSLDSRAHEPLVTLLPLNLLADGTNDGRILNFLDGSTREPQPSLVPQGYSILRFQNTSPQNASFHLNEPQLIAVKAKEGRTLSSAESEVRTLCLLRSNTPTYSIVMQSKRPGVPIGTLYSAVGWGQILEDEFEK